MSSYVLPEEVSCKHCGTKVGPKRHRPLAGAERAIAQLSRLYDCGRICGMCSLGTHEHQERQFRFDPHVFSTMTYSKFFVVGQNPGFNECMEGEPFVGEAGKNFNAEIKKYGINRDEFYITNAVKCHTPGNRAPTSPEQEACEPMLRMEIAIIRPKIIFILGASAFRILCTQDFSERLGKITKTKYGIPAFTIYHPSPRNLEVEVRREAFEKQIRIACGLIKKIKDGALVDNLF